MKVKKQDEELRRPIAEVDRGQCDEHLRNSLHRDNLAHLWGFWLVPRVALESKFGKGKAGKAGAGTFAAGRLSRFCRALVGCSPSILQSRPQVWHVLSFFKSETFPLKSKTFL